MSDGRVKSDLTEKELKFAELKSLNISHSDAVRRAGYNVTNDNSAASLGYTLTKKPLVQEKIQELKQAQAKKLMEHLPELLQNMLDMALGKSQTPNFNARVQFEAIRDLLDRIPGMGKKEKIHVSTEEFPAELLRLMNRLNADEGEA